MRFRYVVLGAGRQGVALAYDLARNCEAESVVLADSDPSVATRAVERLVRLLPACRDRFHPATVDVAEAHAVAELMRGAHVVVSAVPYRFNAALTQIAIACGASFCDLGGNTAVVRSQLAMHAQAEKAGVSIVPDCGLAPGLGNHLAAHGIASMEAPRSVHVRCGGLPQQRVGPLNYKLVFNFQGLINEYSGAGEFLRGGQRVDVPALTEVEQIEFPQPLGWCEAAVTSGGTSTCPETYRGRLQDFDYKTVRYAGHFAVIRAMFELGCFEETLTLRDGTTLAPRALMRRLMEERLDFPDVRDLVVLRVIVRGLHRGRPRTLQYDLLDRHDEATGFTAMERTTAFPAALVAHMQARRIVKPGALPLEVSVPAEPYVKELPAHDIHVQLTTRETE